MFIFLSLEQLEVVQESEGCLSVPHCPSLLSWNIFFSSEIIISVKSSAARLWKIISKSSVQLQLLLSQPRSFFLHHSTEYMS